MRQVLIISAVGSEIAGIVGHFGALAREPGYFFEYATTRYTLVVTGIGMINTAARLSWELARRSFVEIWMVGSCGSYPPEVAIGDVVVAEEEINGDLGIIGANGWQSPELFPFPILQSGKQWYRHRFPCHRPSLPQPREGYQLHYGTMLTVSAVSGIAATAYTFQQRFSALAENMEGAAAAQVALWRGIPFVEIRSVSNRAGSREHADWNTSLAWHNNQQVVIAAIVAENATV